jgi:hypothetical protein
MRCAADTVTPRELANRDSVVNMDSSAKTRNPLVGLGRCCSHRHCHRIWFKSTNGGSNACDDVASIICNALRDGAGEGHDGRQLFLPLHSAPGKGPADIARHVMSPNGVRTRFVLVTKVSPPPLALCPL